VVVNNVYILPGIPKFFSEMLNANMDHFTSSTKFYRVLISTKKLEGEIALSLSQAQEQYPQCEIGSYPHMETKQVTISFEAQDKFKDLVEEVATKVMKEVEGTRVSSLNSSSEEKNL
jgi:molybdopterin-biosynthesis enzyme MoeA-like protein